MQNILEVAGLGKTYKSGSRDLHVLEDIHFSIERGETVAIVGPSGSGKTTLLGLCAGLDHPSTGHVKISGTDITALDENEKAEIRNHKVGFIFQNFQLIPTLTALENVMIPLELQAQPKKAYHKAIELLDRVGLSDRMNHYPAQLSGGEQQRISIARAFCNEPELLFADEPTGNLDDDTGERIEELLFEMNREFGTTLVIVTHDLELAEKTGRIIRLKGGKVMSDQNLTADVQA